MNIKLINRGEEGELLLAGRLDSHTSPEVDDIFQQVAERFERVILNFEYLEYISSSGLRILKRLYVTMQKKEGELALRSVNRTVMEVFEMTGFAGLLDFI